MARPPGSSRGGRRFQAGLDGRPPHRIRCERKNYFQLFFKVRNPHDVLRGRAILDPVHGCWVWQGTKDRDGYGQLRFNYQRWKVHRFVYALLVGPIPADIDVHHICKSKACCNPDHLMLVSKHDHGRMQNGQREKTHCVNGHEFTPENTYRFKGKRLCKACRAIWSAEYRAKGVIGP